MSYETYIKKNCVLFFIELIFPGGASVTMDLEQ